MAAATTVRGMEPRYRAPTTDELDAMTDDDLLAMGSPDPKPPAEPLPDDWMVRKP